MNLALCEMNSSDENSDNDRESSSLESSSDEELEMKNKIQEI